MARAMVYMFSRRRDFAAVDAATLLLHACRRCLMRVIEIRARRVLATIRRHYRCHAAHCCYITAATFLISMPRLFFTMFIDAFFFSTPCCLF